MENFDSYKIEKEKIFQKISLIKQNLCKLEKIGFDCTESFEKISQTEQALKNETLSIVLLGSFSDGKTSVVEFLLGQEMPSMKIASDESSDKLEFYEAKNLGQKCQIVDTPGLFGSENFSSITQKYIDQANIILYVTEAKNPVKESHMSTLKWILQDLDKLSQTIFVINKMDLVCDITSKENFGKMAQIKKGVLSEKLKNLISLSQTDTENLPIVCMSANPDDKGFDFWRENEKIYRERSNIAQLENAINQILQNTSHKDLIYKSGFSSLERVLSENIKLISEQVDKIEKDVIPKMEEGIRRIKKDYESTKKQILSKKLSYVRDLRSYEKRLKSDLRATEFENLENFLSDEIGYEEGQAGYKIEQEIQMIAQFYFEEANQKITDLCKNIELQTQKYNEFLDSTLVKGMNFASNVMKVVGKIPPKKIKLILQSGKDILGKIFGFAKKTRSVEKLAKNISRTIPIVDAALDVAENAMDVVQKNREKKEFEKTKCELEKLISEIFKSVIENAMDNEKYLQQFAPQLSTIQTQLDKANSELAQKKELKRKFLDWKKKTAEDFALNGIASSPDAASPAYNDNDKSANSLINVKGWDAARPGHNDSVQSTDSVIISTEQVAAHSGHNDASQNLQNAPLAHFHLPGLFEFYDFYRAFLPLYFEHPKYFYPWAKIASIYGSPADCLWGGGRSGYGEANANDVLSLLSEYKISSRLTFSNSLLEQNHLSDKKCNDLCKLFENAPVQSGIIVHSDLLLAYLQKNYPKFYFVSSTTKVLTDFSAFKAELNRADFQFVVPDFRLNKDFSDLSTLSSEQKAKVEFLCNECCPPTCTQRQKCYENVSLENLGLPPHPQLCTSNVAHDGYQFSLAMENPAFISAPDIQNIYLPQGFTNFKIEGRSLGSALILEFLLHYLTLPEYTLKVREKIYLDNTLDLF